jgi:hypothetical protein
VERDGAFVLDVEGAVDISRVDEFRANNIALTNQLAEQRKRMEAIESERVKTIAAERDSLNTKLTAIQVDQGGDGCDEEGSAANCDSGYHGEGAKCVRVGKAVRFFLSTTQSNISSAEAVIIASHRNLSFRTFTVGQPLSYPPLYARPQNEECEMHSKQKRTLQQNQNL